MITRRSSLGLAALAALLNAGCDPRFTALTAPPPTAVAELSDEDRTITLSKGVALGFECIAPDGAPCETATAEAEDPALVGVFNGYVDLLSPSIQGGYGYNAGAKPRTIFVVLGRAVGTTTLHITSDDGDAEFRVSVEPRSADAQ